MGGGDGAKVSNMTASKTGPSQAKLSHGSQKAASAGSGSGGSGRNKDSQLSQAVPLRQPSQPEGASNVEAEVLAIRMRLQEEINQHERSLNALRRTHTIDMARAFSSFTNKNNELVKANAVLRCVV